MPNLNISVLGVPGYAKNIGKAGTSSDIIFYNLKKGKDTVTMIEPLRYPERLAPLFYAVSMADSALLVVDGITPEFGETVVMLDTVGVKSGYIVLRNYLDPSQVMPLIKGTVVENYEFLEDDTIKIRELLIKDAEEVSYGETTTKCGVVSIDHFFNVKGIGTVILGGMENGTIHQHDILRVLPGEKTAQVRSVQKHDDNCPEAQLGDRVGLALKNITADELDRGFVLTNDENIVVSDEISGKVKLTKFWQQPIKEGMVLHVGHWMQYISARVESVESDDDWKNPVLSLKLEKEIVYLPGDRAVLQYLDGGKLRVAGTIELHGS